MIVAVSAFLFILFGCLTVGPKKFFEYNDHQPAEREPYEVQTVDLSIPQQILQDMNLHQTISSQ
jgi:hypothetical protein